MAATQGQNVMAQRWNLVRFEAYRRDGDRRSLEDIVQDADYWQLLQSIIPRNTPWVDTDHSLRRAVRQVNMRKRNRARLKPIQGPPIALPDEPQRDLSMRQMRALARRLEQQQIRYCKTVGWGGQGVVTLWKYQNPSSGELEEKGIIIKSSIDRDKDLDVLDYDMIENERQVLEHLARAPHISQIQNLQPLMGRQSAEEQTQRRAIQGNTNFIILEYAKLGSLEQWLRKAGTLGIRERPAHFPRVMAWRFFDCLVKGCMAMERPPRYQAANKTSRNQQFPLRQFPTWNQRRWLRETIHPNGTGDDMCYVHNDLDPSNVLLPGLDEPSDNLDPGHNDISRLQIGDFGLAETRAELCSVPANNDERRAKYAARSTGKASWWLPEQWTAEWEDIGPNGDPYASPQYGAIAGNYGSHSNVWQMGMIMRCILLLEEPPHAPYAERVPFLENRTLPNNNDPNSVPLKDQFWTCGAELFQDRALVRKYGLRLCRLIARCLAYTPAHRPSLTQIQEQITRCLAEEPDGGRVRREDVDFFFDAPGPLPDVVNQNPGAVDIWAGY